MLKAFGLTLVLVAGPGIAQSVLSTFTSEAAFSAATKSPITFGFGSVVARGSFTSFSSYSASGVAFTAVNAPAVDIISANYYSSTGFTYPADFIANAGTPTIPAGILLTFSPPITAMSLQIGSFDGGAIRASFSTGTSATLIPSPTLGGVTFWGFTSSTPFSTLSLVNSDGNPVVVIGSGTLASAGGSAVGSADLAVTAFSAPTSGVIGSTISGTSATVENIGSTPAPAFRLEFYLSKNSVVRTADIDTGWGCDFSGLGALGSSVTCGGTIGIPGGLVPGTYYLAAIADSNNQVSETSKANNSLDSSNGQITLTAVGAADLTISAFSAPTTGVIGSMINGSSMTVQNIGGTAAPMFQVEYYLSKNAVVTTSDVDTGWGCTVPGLAAQGATFSCSGLIGIPTGLAPGAYYLAAIADAHNQVIEVSKANNSVDSSNGRITLTGGVACAYQLSSTTASFSSSAGNGSVGVTTAAGCSWTAGSNATWIHVSSGALGSASGTVAYTVDANLAAGQRSGTMTIASQIFSVTQSGTNPGPTILAGGVVEPWTYRAGISAGAWVAIFGTNFMTGPAVSWAPQLNQPLQTSLAGVTVTFNGIPAAPAYVSSTLLNVLVPSGVPVGNVSIVVNSNGVSSSAFPIVSTPFLQAIYANAAPGTSPPRFYVTAVDSATGQLLGNISADARVVRGVRPSETIDLFCIGLGPTSPQFPTNVDFSAAYPPVSNFNVVIGGVSLTPTFAALVAPGLYQVRVTPPPSLAPGDQTILFDFGTMQSTANVFLTIEP